MINVYIAKTEFEFLNFLSLVSPKKNKELTFIDNENFKKNTIVANLLLQVMLNKLYKLKIPQDFDYDKNGKPFLVNSDICYNISHTKDYVCVATSQNNIGVDIEQKNRKIFNINSLSKKILTSSEINDFNKCENKLNALTKFWSQKESCLKFLGDGIKKGLNTISVSNNKLIDLDTKKEYFLRNIEIEDCWLSICSEKEKQINFKICDLEKLLNEIKK